MISLSRGSPNDELHLTWMTFIGGILADAVSVQFEVWDIRSGEPGSQKYPIVGHSANVTKYSTGRYFAVFTPASSWVLGEYKIKWFVQEGPGDPIVERVEYFEIVEEPGVYDNDAPDWIVTELRFHIRDTVIPSTSGSTTIGTLFTDQELRLKLNDALNLFDSTMSWDTFNKKYKLSVIYRAWAMCCHSLAMNYAILQRIQLRDSIELDIGQVSNHLLKLAEDLKDFADKSTPISPNSPGDVTIGTIHAWSYRTGQMIPVEQDVEPEQLKLSITLTKSNTVWLTWSRPSERDVDYLEIYRSTSSDVTDDDDLITTVSFDDAEYYYEDDEVTSGTYYYTMYIYDHRDQYTKCNEVSIVVP